MNPDQTPETPPATDVSPTPITPETPIAPPAPSTGTTGMPAAADPGKTLAIVGLVLSILGIGVVGIILSAVALQQSKKTGHKNAIALAGIIVGIVSMLLGALYFLIISGAFIAAQ